MAVTTYRKDLYRLGQALLAGQAGWLGFQYLAFGVGDPSWDGEPPPAAASDGTGALLGEFARVPISATNYFVEADGVTISATPTLLLRVECRLAGNALGETYATPKVWRELALVGGTATAALGSGLYTLVVRDAPQVRSFGDADLIVSITLAGPLFPGG